MKKILIMGLVWAASIPFILAQKGIDLRPYVYVQMEKGAERIIELKCSHPLIGDDYIFIYFKQLDENIQSYSTCSMLGQFQEVYISKIEKDYLRLENVLASEMNGKIDSVIFDSASMPWLVQKGYVDSLSFTFHNRAEPPTLVHVNSIRAFELPAVSLQLKNGKKYKALFFNAVAVEKKIDPNKELPEERIMKSRAAYLKGIGIGYIRIDVGHGMVLEYEFNSILDKAGFDKRLEELGKKLNNGTK